MCGAGHGLSLPLWVPGQGLCVVQVTGFRKVCPVHLQCPWRISSPAGCCLVCLKSSLLLMVSGRRIQRILLRQMLNVWVFFSVTAVVLYISTPYNRTGSTEVMVRLGKAQMFFIWKKAALALPNLAFTSASVPFLLTEYSCTFRASSSSSLWSDGTPVSALKVTVCCRSFRLA